jgi:septum formation protein
MSLLYYIIFCMPRILKTQLIQDVLLSKREELYYTVYCLEFWEVILTQNRKIVLASASPRRKELLEKMGLTFQVDASESNESLHPGLKPEDMAKTISREKVLKVASRYPDAVIIAADTFGVFRGKIIGKPSTADEAKRILSALSGKSHRVITGYTIVDTKNGRTITDSVETRVYFKKLAPEEIDNYVNSGEPLDKAGAYGIQGLGSIIVEKIKGDYYNVMGLPICALAESLKNFDIFVL